MKNDSKHKKHAEYAQIDHSDEVKRLNRIMGQIEGVRKMLEGQRKLEDVLIQCKAIHSALKSIETRILKAHLDVALDEIVKIDKKKNRAEKVAELEELFKHAS
jgi:DNA-binding FrmR family transcriptional regulator